MADNPKKIEWSEELKNLLDSSFLQARETVPPRSFHDDQQPDWWRYLYSVDGSWDAGILLSIAPAVKHLKEVFDDIHTNAGLITTQRLCYASLHDGLDKYGDANELDETFKSLAKMAALATPEVFNWAKQEMFVDNPAAKLAAYFGLYVDIVGNVAYICQSHIDWR